MSNRVRLLCLFLFVAVGIPLLIAQFVDPTTLQILDDRYLNITEGIDGELIEDGSITPEKLTNLPPDKIIGTALTEATIFSGPNISGTYNGLVIEFPAEFVTSAELASEGFATEVFVLSQGYLTAEVDPKVTGLSVTQTWVAGGVTNVQVFTDGLLKSWSTNGVAL